MFQVSLDRFIPLMPAPGHLFTSVGSLGLAAAVGGTYGLIGRVISPQSGINPINYAIWFVVAYQIKQLYERLEVEGKHFLGARHYFNYLERLDDDEMSFGDQLRFACWKVIVVKDYVLTKIDDCFSYVMNIRPYREVTAENVQDASFIEMSRFRLWNVFKSTIVDNTSFSLAHGLTHKMGFALPMHTSIPLFILVQSIAKNIFLVPMLYKYMHFCNYLAAEIDEGAESTATQRAEWLKRILPQV